MLWFAVAHAADLLLADVHVVDALGPRGPVDVLVRDGLIVEIGDVDAPDAIVRTGGYVVPGLIDTHVHLSMAPGAAFRDPDPDPAVRRAHHLRAYLAAGVTTILDPGILPDDAAEIAELAATGPAPRFLYLGPLISPTNGYVHTVIPELPGVATPEEAVALFSTFDALDPVGVKVTMEPGPVFHIWELHPPEVRAAIVAEAARRDLPIYVHAMEPDMYAAALELGATCVVHGPSKPLPKALTAQLVDAGTTVSTTLSIAGSGLLGWDPLDRADLVALVPADELATARDPYVRREYRARMLDVMAPKLRAVRGLAVSMAAGRGAWRRRLKRDQRAIVRLADAGVPLVLGSDAGNWPILPFLFHGPSTHLELELLVDAGLTPLQAITAATATPARLLDLPVGTIEVGRRADLVVTDTDPLADVTALRTPALVVRDGVGHTPAEWLASSAR